MKESPGKKFRQVLSRNGLSVMPHAYDAFSALLIQQAGFDAALVGGSSINWIMGYPDGEATRTEFLGRVREITAAVTIPVRVDIETGYGAGTALDLMRTIRECERIGVGAVQCEDQVTEVKNQLSLDKKVGIKGAYVVPREEMLKKIEAALEARQDKDLVFIARTDARPRYGLEETLERGRAYARAGADMIVVHSLQSVDELKKAVDYIGAPLLVNSSDTDKLSLSTEEVEKIGVKILSVGAPLRTVGWALQQLFQEIRRTGTDKGVVDRMIGKNAVADLVGTPARDALRTRFLDYK